MSDNGLMKLYFEEIPIVESDGDSNVKIVENLQNQVDSANFQGNDESSKTVELENGGILSELRFDSCGFDAEKDERLKVCVPAETEIYNVAEEDSSQNPSARGGCSLSIIGDFMYVFGGASRDGTHYNDVWRSHIPGLRNEVRWENISSLVVGNAPKERSGHSATDFKNDMVVFFGGLNALEQQVYNDVHILKHENDGQVCWLPIESNGCPPQPRTEHSGCKFDNDTIIYFGGSSPTAGPLRDIHVLDLKDINNKLICTWSTLRCFGPSPIGRELHSACIFGLNSSNMKNCLLEHYGGNELDHNPSLKQITLPCLDEEQEIKQDDDNSLKEEANRLFVTGNYDKACQLYTQVLEKNPTNYIVYGHRSACKLNLKQPEQALQDALCAIRLNPRSGKGYYREAMALTQLKQYDQARTAFQAAIELATSDQEREKIEKARQKILSENATDIQNQKQPEKEIFEDMNNNAPFLCIFGGRATDSVLNDVSILSLKTLQWNHSSIQSPFPRCGHTAAKLEGDKMLVFGGWDGGMNVFNKPILYDFSTMMWTECYNKDGKDPEKRFSHAGNIIQDQQKVILFGGVSFEKDLSDIVTTGLA